MPKKRLNLPGHHQNYQSMLKREVSYKLHNTSANSRSVTDKNHIEGRGVAMRRRKGY